MTEQDAGISVEERGRSSKKVYYKKWIGRLSVERDQPEDNTMSRNSRNAESQERKSCSAGVCCAKFWFFGFGGLIAAAGIVLCILWPTITSRILKSELALSPTSYMYDKWVVTPIPMYQKFYLFNWTNIEDSIKNGDKPVFQEMGPYVFSMKYRKKNLTWNENDTVTYFLEREYHFVPDLSNGSLTDKVTSINVVAVTVSWFVSKYPWLVDMFVNEFLKLTERSLIKTDTVINLLLAGSEDPLLDLAAKIAKVVKKLKVMKKFAFFYQKNMTLTADGVYTVATGQDELNKVGLVEDWNYKTQTVFSGECGRVHGSFGDEFPPNSTQAEQIFIFANDLCSVLPLTRDRTSSVLDVPTVRFVGANDTFSNSSACYCTQKTCPASGARDVSACQGAPILMSWPHFYLADPSYTEAVEGMNPDPDKHQFSFELSEVTAVPMKVRVRIQINLQVTPVKHMNLFKKLPKLTAPMVWFSQEADMSSSIGNQLFWAERAVDWGRWVALGVGALGLLHIATGVVLQLAGCFRPRRR